MSLRAITVSIGIAANVQSEGRLRLATKRSSPTGGT